MRTDLNFSPLFRSTIGFDRVFDLLENASQGPSVDSWPPYDIVRTGEDTYRITMATAGFSEEDLTITHQRNLLVVAGSKATEEKSEYLHRGISAAAFERRFELADHLRVTDATLQNGLLTISLLREVPEEMKPRRVQIKTEDAGQGAKQIQSSKQVA
jgi:molecular chaperone IbpA